ncbi:MAG: hypothetical protein A2075_00390 [Geobacteraceae bacterium GWC2_58_44]|nr:MAG: hypothetical protein A2075_00390 [Geobacteraceae bacterium GWC2_58_44]HBG07100.1 hypothetical protein [Geobacter sp.]
MSRKIFFQVALISLFFAVSAFGGPDGVKTRGNLRILGDGNGLVFPDGSMQSKAAEQGPIGPSGPAGPANTLSIGTVATGASDSQAAATITGSSPNQVLNLTIPQGPGGQVTLATICAAISAENAQLPSFCFTSSYEPLQVGNKWVYTSLVPGKHRNDEIIGAETLYGLTTYIKQRLEPSPDDYQEKNWLAYDGSSLLLFRIWANEGADQAIDLSPPAVLNKISPQLGDSWSWGIPNAYTANVEVLAVNDTVTVPAGTFHRCIKIKETAVPSGKVKIIHYAPGVGMIRYENQGSWVEELVYARAGSKTYGVAP